MKIDNESGKVEVNEYEQSSIPNIYAIGDIMKVLFSFSFVTFVEPSKQCQRINTSSNSNWIIVSKKIIWRCGKYQNGL